MTAKPRKTPCASCPYRCNVPSGVWHEEEYDKLPAYDRDTADQPTAVFYCHQADGAVCAGWLGFGDPGELLAVRIGTMFERLDPSCMEYATDVPLFASGQEAADHGKKEIDTPTIAASAVILKIEKKRAQSAG